MEVQLNMTWPNILLPGQTTISQPDQLASPTAQLDTSAWLGTELGSDWVPIRFQIGYNSPTNSIYLVRLQLGYNSGLARLHLFCSTWLRPDLANLTQLDSVEPVYSYRVEPVYSYRVKLVRAKLQPLSPFRPSLPVSNWVNSVLLVRVRVLHRVNPSHLDFELSLTSSTLIWPFLNGLGSPIWNFVDFWYYLPWLASYFVLTLVIWHSISLVPSILHSCLLSSYTFEYSISLFWSIMATPPRNT